MTTGNKKFVPIPGFQAPSLPLATLSELVDALKKHGITEVKFSSTNQPFIPRTDEQSFQLILEEIGRLKLPRGKAAPSTGPDFAAIRSCPDSANCRYGIRDTTQITTLLDSMVLPGELPAKVKLGIAGCVRCCTSPFIRDIGLIAEPKGWKLVFGGNGGGRPRIGDVVATGLNDGQAVELILRCLIIYIAKAKPKMRTARFMEYYGADRFIQEVHSQEPHCP